MEAYLLELQHIIFTLEIENENLKRQLEAKNNLLQCTSDILLNNDIHDAHTKSEKRIIQRAKWRFYQINKNKYARSHWRQTKKETDMVFDTLDDTEKHKYF